MSGFNYFNHLKRPKAKYWYSNDISAVGYRLSNFYWNKLLTIVGEHVLQDHSPQRGAMFIAKASRFERKLRRSYLYCKQEAPSGAKKRLNNFAINRRLLRSQKRMPNNLLQTRSSFGAIS